MQGDEFVNNSLKNKNEEINDDANFFVQSELPIRNNLPEHLRHINDYDFNLLKEDAYKDISDDILKLEYKISKTEQSVISLDKQIQAAKEIGDFDSVETLSTERRNLQENLDALKSMYNQASFSARISGRYFTKIKENLETKRSFIFEVLQNLLSKIPGNLSYVIKIKNSLNKLENINKSVDELMSMQIPYGEAAYQYQTLSKYIAKANSIQAEIARHIK